MTDSRFSDSRVLPAALSPAKRALLERRLGRNGAAAIPRRLDPGPAPLSFAQERLWLLDQLIPEGGIYNVPRLMRVPMHLDPHILRAALEQLALRHEVLRMRIVLAEGIPMQVTAGEPTAELEVVDLRHVAEDERSAEAERIATELACRSFRLGVENLLRAALIRMSDNEDWLLVVSHHLASDEGSKKALFSDLGAIYDALARGDSPELPELPIQYADFAVWERSRLHGRGLDDLLSYWAEHLSGAPEVLGLPTDRPRPPLPSHRGGRRFFLLPANLQHELTALAQRNGTTFFTVALAAFKVLLYRYSGSPDIVVGTAVSGRHRAETNGLVGYFANTLPIRTQLDRGDSFLEHLQHVREAAIGAYAHQELPFERLVEVLNPTRDLSHSPIFQVSLVHDPVAFTRPTIAGCAMEPLPLDRGLAKFDLTLALYDVPSRGLGGFLEYSSDLFDEATIDRTVGHLETLLDEIARNPNRRPAELKLLPAEERRQVLVHWNDTARDFGPHRAVQQLFEDQVERTPDAPAVAVGPDELSYRELNAHADAIAEALRERGVGPETIVAVCLERAFELPAALLGVLKAGGAYLPLDPNYPPARIAAALEDANAPIVLTQQRLVSALPETDAEVLCVDGELTHAGDYGVRHDTFPPDRLAYVIYTSGSTGRPKGVMIEHGALANTTLARLEFFPSPPERFLLLTTIAFDSSVAGLFWTLATGGCLVLMEEGRDRDPLEIRRVIDDRQITHTLAVPSLYGPILESGDPAALSSLRTVIVAGEACPSQLPLLHRATVPQASLYNEYGPTECTVWATAQELHRSGERVSIGRPISNVRTYVLDELLEPVPVGVPGELYLGGAGVARGYFNAPDLTAERFVPDPFGAEGERLYRTGDVVRFLADGELEFLGRVDHQVKIRGFRIELGEIEAILGQHPAVRKTVVVAREDGSGALGLVAYVIPRSTAPTAKELRQFLRANLPEHMVPAAFVTLEALPFSPNGKVDRKALPAPDPAGRDDRPYVAPSSPIEVAVAEIWSELFGLDSIGASDDFFELGGHSLLAFRMLSRVRSDLEVDLLLRDAFEHSTVAELAAVIADRLMEHEAPAELESLLAEVEGSVQP